MKYIVDRVGIFLSIIFSSIYLLFRIEMEVSLNKYQMLFLFFYLFFLFIGIIWFIQKNGIGKGKKDKKSMFIVLAISLLICFLEKDIFIPKRYQDKIVEITAIGEKNKYSLSYEVWIHSIKVNGNTIELEDIDGTDGWVLKEGALLSNVGETRNSFKIQAEEMKGVEIIFGMHDWSGMVEVKCDDQVEKIDLYSANGGGKEINIVGEYKEIGLREIALFCGSYVTVVLFFSFVLSLLEWKKMYRWKRVLVSEVLFAIMIKSELQGFLTKTTIITGIILIAIVGFLFDDIRKSDRMKPYFTIKNKVLIGLCDLYATFAVIGHFLFLRMDDIVIDLPKIMIFLLGFLLLYYQIICFIYLFKLIENKIYIRNAKRENKKETSLKIVKLQCFLIMFIPLIIISLGYYPGNMTSDGVDQWAQAIGITPIYNAHPAIHTLFLRMCSKIAKTPFSVVVAHIVIFVLLWTSLFAFLYEKGFNLKAIYMIAFFIVCMPNNYIMLCLISKNVLYALIVLWNMYLFIRFLDDSKNFFCWKRIIEFSMALALLNTVRHNGFLGTYTIWLVLVVWGIYERKTFKYTPFLIVGLSWLIILGIKGPLYQYFDVQGLEKRSGSVSNYNLPLLTPAGMFLLVGEDIPEVGMKIAEKIGSIEEWKENYNPYNGDKISWGKLRNNFLKCSQKESFQLYFVLLKENPFLVIKDRLYAIDILWNVVQPTESYNRYGAYNARYAIGIWPPEWLVGEMPELLREDIRSDNNYYFKWNKLTKLGEIGIGISVKTQLSDVIFWRNGVYVILGILLILINYIDKKRKFNIVILPAFAILCTLVLAGCWQIYQYYWFFSLSILYFGLYTLGVKSSKNIRH